MAVQRFKRFLFITYPESMGNIYEKIEVLGLTCVRSPLHDQDYNKETGEIKKPHYHNMILLDGVKTEKQIKEICSLLKISHYEEVYDTRQSLRYFCHLDCKPESGKIKYPIDQVVVYGDFDYNRVLTSKDGIESVNTTFIKWLREKGQISSFRALVDMVADMKPEYLENLVEHAYFYNLYVRPRDQNL